jgi:hypothetical protein
MGKLDKLFIAYLSSYPDSSEADCILWFLEVLSMDKAMFFTGFLIGFVIGSILPYSLKRLL